MLGIIFLLKLPTILILAWAFRHPEESLRPGRSFRWVLAVAAVHLLLAVISLTGEKSSLAEMFVAYPLIWSVLLRNRLRRFLPDQAPPWLLGILICLLLWFEETWVIVDHRSPPVRHYVHYFAFYLGVAATIVWLYRRYCYSVQETFFVGGLWGMLVEQQFACPKLLLAGKAVEAIGFALYVFPVYGLYLAAPRLLFFEEFNGSDRVSRWQGLWLFFTISVLPLAVWMLWSALLDAGEFDRSGVP